MAARYKYGVVLALLMASGMGYYYFSLLLPRAHALRVAAQIAGGHAYGGDLYPIWLTGRELLQHRRDPYTPEMTRQIQIGVYGRPLDSRRTGDPVTQYRAFAYPLYADFLALPLLPWSFHTVQVALTFLLPLMAAGSVLLWMDAMKIALSSPARLIWVLLTLFTYPVLEGLYAQQPALFAATILAAALWAITRGRLARGGILLALSSVKPQLIALLAAWLLIWAACDWGRRKSLIRGFVLTMLSLLLTSEIALPGWFAGWWHTLVQYRQYTEPPLAELLMGKFLGRTFELLFLLLAAFVAWRTRREPESSAGFSFATAFLLAIAIATLPTGGAVYDHVVLIPAVLWLYSRRREILSARPPVRGIAILGCGLICWPWISGSVLAVLNVLFPGHVTGGLVLLPVRTAASLPLVLLALMSFFAVAALGERE
jgi:hypothetical protein